VTDASKIYKEYRINKMKRKILLVVAIQNAKPTNPLIPKYLIGFATRQSVILEFAPTFISVIMAGKMGPLSLQYRYYACYRAD
jgi:hypothetical protein